MLDIAERIMAFAAGIAIVVGTFLSAVRTFVLPRSSPTILTRVIFLTMRDLFSIFEKRATTYQQRDRILALYAPLLLLAATITAPPARWSSDRAPKRRRPPTLKIGK